MGAGNRYLLDNRDAAAGTRLAALAELLDPWTFSHLERLGVGDGWHCWEAGAGGPSVALWLTRQVGAGGHVLATDIDLSWMPADAPFEKRRHALGIDPVPLYDLDLVHARLVLVHLPERARVIRDLISALRPGGWLLLEEADPGLQPLVCLDEVGPAEALANRLKRRFRDLMVASGVDLAFGRKLPGLLRAGGLDDVEADAFFPICSPACDLLETATIQQVRSRLVDAGMATNDEVEAHLANVRTGQMDLTISPLISAWGRKPI